MKRDKSQAEESLRDILRQNGFYNAQVTTSIKHDDKWEQAHIEFVVKEGRRAHYSLPLVAGESAEALNEVIRATHWKRLYGFLNLGWQQVTEARTRQGVENVRRYLEKKSLLESKVTLTKLDYLADRNVVQAGLQVDPGPRIQVRIVGARVSSSRLAQVIPIFQERSLDTDLLLEGERSLTHYLQDEGYFEAEVTHSVSSGKTAKEQIVSYQVTRGSRHKFVHLEIEGAHYFEKATLLERLTVQPFSLPRYPFGKFSREYLDQDLQSIRSLYSSNGFRDVKVTPSIVDDYRGSEDHLAVTIRIEEGKQWAGFRTAV